MYQIINVKTFREEYVLYYLSDSKGNLLQLDCTRFVNLTTLTDIPITSDEILTQTIIAKNIDKNILMNVAQTWCSNMNCQHLFQEFLKRTSDKKNGYIVCNDTGEIFATVRETCDKHNLSYAALINHLKRRKSYNSVKGKTYTKIEG